MVLNFYSYCNCLWEKKTKQKTDCDDCPICRESIAPRSTVEGNELKRLERIRNQQMNDLKKAGWWKE